MKEKRWSTGPRQIFLIDFIDFLSGNSKFENFKFLFRVPKIDPQNGTPYSKTSICFLKNKKSTNILGQLINK